MADNDGKILKALEDLQKGQKALQADVTDIKADVTDIKTEQKDQSSAIARLEDRQALIEREIYEVQKDQAAIKGMITLLNSNVVKTAQNHETRIKNLEEHTGTENPLKH